MDTVILHTISSGIAPLSFLSNLSRHVVISSMNTHTSFCARKDGTERDMAVSNYI